MTEVNPWGSEAPVAVLALSGSCDGRPEGFPCFGCGAQVTEERGVPVEWPDGRETWEAVCSDCAPRYGLASATDPIRLHDCGRFHRPSEPCRSKT